MATPIALLPGGVADGEPSVAPSGLPTVVVSDEVRTVQGVNGDALDGAAPDLAANPADSAPPDRSAVIEPIGADSTVVADVGGVQVLNAAPERAEPVATPVARPPRIAWGDDVPLVLPLHDPGGPKSGRGRDGRVAWPLSVRVESAAPASGAPLHADTPVTQVRARLADAARDAIERDLCVDLLRERGGFLVGTVERLGEGRLLVDVRAAIPAEGADGGSSWWQLTPQAWDHASRILEMRYPDLLIVGWYHSHPGLGCFFSGTDRETQRHVFPNPWNLAAVGDPVAARSWWRLRGVREAVPPGAMPFRWFLGADAASIAAPEGYDDAPVAPLAPAAMVRRAPISSAPRWRLPRLHRRRR